MGMDDERTEKVKVLSFIAVDNRETFAEKKVNGSYTVKGIESLREKIRQTTKNRMSDKNPIFEV